MLTTPQAAQLVGSTPGSLEEQRSRGVGLPYVKISKAVKYRADHIAEFLESQTVRPMNVDMSDAA